jgi:hypothetical protein
LQNEVGHGASADVPIGATSRLGGEPSSPPAHRSGFASRDHLTRAFEARFGTSIGEYAALAAEGRAPQPVDAGTEQAGSADRLGGRWTPTTCPQSGGMRAHPGRAARRSVHHLVHRIPSPCILLSSADTGGSRAKGDLHMRGLRFTNRGTRRVATAALGGTMALAIVGGSLLSTTAANADTLSCVTTSGTTTLLNVTGSGGGLVNLGSTGGVVGIATMQDGTQVGLLGCTAVVSVGGTTPGATTATITTPTTTPTVTPPSTPTTPTTTPTVPTTTTPTTTTPTTAPPTTAPPSGSPSPTPSSSAEPTAEPTATKVATVKVTTSTATVYPSAKGYSKSKVTFSVKGLTSAKGAVTITGKAVLKKGTKVVKTWKINSSTSKLTWNGRIGKKVKAGVYKLTVTAWSSDGTKKVSTTKVRVSSKHLVTRTASLQTRDLSHATTNVLPKAVKKAFKYGKVTFRTHTVAKVTGPAHLVIVGPNGERVKLRLKDGSHTTKAAVLPKGFTKAKFLHRWKKSDAELLSLRTTFTYKALV